ncbi:MAG: hypothetical protein C5B54_00620 [Acidobacteria bacterium]|nr:MAG: hypothetical protein C5B54_00620 [Acidobacteriota bacterium]
MDIFPNWTVLPILIFLLTLMFVLRRTFFDPLGSTLNERHHRIEGARKEAEEIRKASQDRIAEYDRRMKDARRESGLQIAKVKNEAVEQRTKLIAEKRTESEKMLSDARVDIQKRTAEASKELQQQSSSFAAKIASRILKRPVGRTSA